MLGYFAKAFVAVRGFHGTLLERAQSERGASMVEYALLVSLIAVVLVLAVKAFGGSLEGQFTNANNCVHGLSSAC